MHGGSNENSGLAAEFQMQAMGERWGWAIRLTLKLNPRTKQPMLLKGLSLRRSQAEKSHT
jgi:hypothetical protein